MPVKGLSLVALLAVAAIACSTEEPKEGKDGPPDTTADTGAGCSCPADTVCATQRCLPNGTCEAVPRPDGTPCSDGDVCSVGDVCSEGKCAAGPHSQCECKDSNECADDDDKCNGAQFCDKKTLPWRCRTKPGSVVVCKPVGGSVSAIACAVSTCDPKTGKCATVGKNEGLSCDDGDKCTVDETCTKGACSGINVCSCKSTKDCAAQDDGNPCNGELFCDIAAGTCAVNPTTVIKCPTKDDTECTAATCSKTTGLCQLTARPATTTCDDGDKCTTGDHCSGGSCVAGNVTCACKTNKDCLAFDDGDMCNGIPVCDKTSGTCKPNPASVVSCPSVNDTACLHNVCLPKEGTCTMTARADVKLSCETKKDASGKPYQACTWRYKQPGDAADKGPFSCSDGDLCTTGETCDGGKCKPSATVCKCKTNADCVDKDDGDLCNGTYYCDKSLKIADCVFNPASKVLCSKKDDTTCAQAQCDKKTGNCGLQSVNLGKPCDDGKLCTIASVCQGDGGCAGGKANPCDDKDPCTIDSCSAMSGCGHKARNCDDGNACTADACDKKTGQCVNKAKADNTVCDADGSGCTVGDGCQKGVCKAGLAVKCKDDAGSCQKKVCQSLTATTHKCIATNLADGTACPDNADSCLIGATCKAGSCVAGKVPRLRSFTLYSGKTWSTFNALGQLPDGGVVAVGAANLKADKTRGITTMSLVRMDAMFDAKYVWFSGPAEASLHSQAQYVFMDDAGVPWVAGTTKAKSGIQLKLIRFEKNFKTSGAFYFNPTESDDFLTAATRGPGGFYFAGGTASPKGAKGYSLLRVDETGKQVWSRQIKLAGRAMTTMVMTGASLLFTAGSGYDSKGEPREEVWRLWSPVNGGQYDVIWDSAEDVRAAVDVISYNNMVVGVLQWFRQEGETRTLFTNIDSKLAYGRRIEGTSKGGVPTAMAISASGSMVLVGHTSTKDDGAVAKADAWMRVADPFTNILQEHTWGGSGHEELRDVVVNKDGLIIAAGRRDVGGIERAWLQRMGPWGYRTCGASGACWKMTPSKCQDNKACTRDFCDPKAGCKHTNHADFSACTPPYKCSAMPTCISGACKVSVNGRLHVGGLMAGPDSTLIATDGTHGDTRVWRFRNKQLQMWDVSKLGFVTSPYKYDVCEKMFSVDAGIRLTTGDIALAGKVMDKVNGKDVLRSAFCLADIAPNLYDSGDADTAWLHKVGPPKLCPSCNVWGVAAAQTVDNSIYALTRFSGAQKGAIVSRIQANGKAKWSFAFRRKTGGIEPAAIIANQDGAPVVAGTYVAGTTSYGWLMRMNVFGHKVWDRHYLNTKPMLHGRFFAVSESTYRGYIAAGIAQPNKLVNKAKVLGVDGNGKELWTWTPPKVDMSSAKVVMPGPGAAVTVMGDVQIGGKSRPQLRIIGSGKLLVERINPFVEMTVTPGVAARIADGGLIVGGSVKDEDGYAGPGYLRTNPSGFSSCATAKECFLKGFGACDDKNPCTVDVCQPGAGCKHSPITGAQCGASHFCKAGKCVKTP